MVSISADNGVDHNVAYTLIYNNIKNSMGKKTVMNLKAGLRDILELKALIEDRDSSIKTIRKRWERIRDSTWPEFYKIASKITPTPPTSPESTSESESESGSDSSSTSAKSPVKGVMSAAKIAAPLPASSDSSSSSSDSDESVSKPSISTSNTKTGKKPVVSSSSSSSSSGSESDDEADTDVPNDLGSKAGNKQSPTRSTPKKAKAKSPCSSSSNDTLSSSNSEDEISQPVKKRRTDERGTSVVIALEKKASKKIIAANDSAPENNAKCTASAVANGSSNGVRLPNGDGGSGTQNKRKKGPRKSNPPFQRIKVDDVTFTDERLKDNSFAGLGEVTGDYGERASKDLIVTRGDGFRKEKNKKKRGSYHGGEITLGARSIKLT